MGDGPSGLTGRPAVRRAGEEFRLVFGLVVILYLAMEGKIVKEIMFKFSHVTIFSVKVRFCRH